MNDTGLDALFQRISKLKAVCIGDVVLDRFVTGDAQRVSREAPVITLSQGAVTTAPGAVGNVARNAAALGAIVSLVTVVGDDPEGQGIVSALGATELADLDVIAARGRVTPTKTRFVARGQQLLCVDRDPEGPLGAEDLRRLTEAVVDSIAEADVVLMVDQDRGALPRTVCEAAINAARLGRAPLIVDPRGRDFTRYDGASIIKPNAAELAIAAGLPTETDLEVEAALSAALARLTATDCIVVTRGPDGMSILSRGADVRHTPQSVRGVKDAAGAGDTALAALGLAIAAGAHPIEAMVLADIAATVAISKAGVAAPTGAEVMGAARSGAVPMFMGCG